VAKQLAKEKNLNYNEDMSKINDKGNFSVIDIRMSQMDISDIRGLPKFDESNKTTRWYYPDFLPTNSQGIIFLDELNTACFPKGTIIMTENGIENIENIKPNMKVLGQNGEYENVVNIFERDYNQNIITIKASGMVSLNATEDHPFLASERKYVHIENKNNKCGQSNIPVLSEPKWIKSKDLTINHLLAIPILKGDLEVTKLSIREFLGRDFPKCANIDVTLNEELAELMGIFVAEGWASTNRMGIGLGSHEKELIERTKMLIEKCIGYKIQMKIDEINHSCVLRFAGNILAKAFRAWFGTGAKTKKIPDFILRNKNIEILRSFLIGYFKGDGSIIKGKSFTAIAFATVSETLAYQLQLAFTRFGVLSSVCRYEYEPKSFIIENKKNGKKLRIISGCGLTFYIKSSREEIFDVLNVTDKYHQYNKKKTNKKCFYYYKKNGFLFTKIRKIEKGRFNDKVYNFETEKTHTYVVNNIIVHNCPSVQITAYSLTLDRRVGSYNLPDGWQVISAGNRISDKASIFECPAPLNNRFMHIELEVPSVDDWVDNFAIENKIDTRISTFLKFKPVLYKFDSKINEKAFPSPRTWAICSEMISDKETRDLDTINILVASCVGEATAIEFTAWLKLSEKIDIEEILKNPLEAKLPREIDMTYAMISGILEHYKKDRKLMKPIVQLATRLTPEFAVMMLKLVKTHNTRFVEEVVNLPEWKKDLAKKLQPYFKEETD
jgi:intein/homing endonuclease